MIEHHTTNNKYLGRNPWQLHYCPNYLVMVSWPTEDIWNFCKIRWFLPLEYQSGTYDFSKMELEMEMQHHPIYSCAPLFKESLHIIGLKEEPSNAHRGLPTVHHVIFFLWLHIKSIKVYKSRPSNVVELEHCIRYERSVDISTMYLIFRSGWAIVSLWMYNILII